MSKKVNVKASAIDPDRSEEGGNTILPSRANVKQISPAKRWAFTLNNYTDPEILLIENEIKKSCSIGFFNKEVGESGTPHLQGYVEFKFKCRPKNLFPERVHWEKAAGSRDSNMEYCSKDCLETQRMTFEHGVKRKIPLRVFTELRPWQASVVNLIQSDWESQEDRGIHWVCDVDGCQGKTQFCKYLTTKYKQVIIITGGAYKDIAQILAAFNESETNDLNDDTVIIFNIPREADEKGLISYKALESLKDGLITSVKYESTTMVFNSPSVWVFSNEMPSIEKLSVDRWNIYTINNLQLKKMKYKPAHAAYTDVIYNCP